MLSKMRQKHLYWNVLKCTKVWWSKGQSVGCTCSLFGTWADQVLCHYCDLCGHPQGCFDQRMRAWQRWQEAQSTLQKKREAEAKLLWANKPDKLQQAKEDITEVTHIHTHTHAHTRTHTPTDHTAQRSVLELSTDCSSNIKILIFYILGVILLTLTKPSLRKIISNNFNDLFQLFLWAKNIFSCWYQLLKGADLLLLCLLCC